MSTTSHPTPDIEELLRAALTARAELVQPEDLAPLAPVVELRPRWRSPWVLLATVAVVLLILGVVFQGLDSRPRSDRLAPKPDAPRLELPADVGRDWKPDDLSTPARLDLDGDGVKEKVEFLGEPTKNFDGRIRLQTTLSTTGEESYGIAELGTTIGVTALGPIDADDDGDQELVLWYDDPDAVGGGGYPLVFDLRDGLLVRAAVEDADLLRPRAGARSRVGRRSYYEMVRMHDYWSTNGRLMSSRSVGTYASGGMSLFTPRVLRGRRLGVDPGRRRRAAARGGRLPAAWRPTGGGRAGGSPRRTRWPCPSRPRRRTSGSGKVPPSRAVSASPPGSRRAIRPCWSSTGPTAARLRHDLDVPDPRVPTVQPESVFYDGASVVVTSESDPRFLQVLVQRGDRLVELEPVGDVPLEDEGAVAHVADARRVRCTPPSWRAAMRGWSGSGRWCRTPGWRRCRGARCASSRHRRRDQGHTLLKAISSTPGSGDQSRSGSRV